MPGIIWIVLGIIALGWFLRRMFPALFAATLVLLAPLWLLGGLLLDLAQRPLDFLQSLSLGMVRLVGVVLVLPLLPLIFVWSFCTELWRQFRLAKTSSTPAPAAVETLTPIQTAARRTADVIDLAAARQRRSGQ